MKFGRLKTVLLIFVVFSLPACSSILPREDVETQSPWQSYEEAEKSFEQIKPGETLVEDLGKMGFDPNQTPNIKHVTYIDLLTRFLPNQSISLDNIDPEVSTCLKAHQSCYGLMFNPGKTHRERFGNAFLDIFGFKRQTRITGWRFEGLILVLEEKVIYKIAGGNSNINELEVRKRPLGPIQEIDIRGSVDI